MTSKITVAAAGAALALGMSTLFGGVAFAWDHGNNIGGSGGNGGNSSTRCAVPVGISGALILAQSNDVQQCDANAGNGGNGGEAKSF